MFGTGGVLAPAYTDIHLHTHARTLTHTHTHIRNTEILTINRARGHKTLGGPIARRGDQAPRRGDEVHDSENSIHRSRRGALAEGRFLAEGGFLG